MGIDEGGIDWVGIDSDGNMTRVEIDGGR